MADAPRLASRMKVDALMRRVASAGGFATVLVHGDDSAGALAVVTRESGTEILWTAVLSATGRYIFANLASGTEVPIWVERACRRDPDLWVVELDIPLAGQFVAEMLADD